MSKSTKTRITQEQGNVLLQFAANFMMPDKLGETTYNVAERGLANRDVGTLYRELKAYSPLLLTKRKALFGPAENWKQGKIPNGQIGQESWVLEKRDQEIRIRLDDDARMGAYYCLLMALHPMSAIGLLAGVQEDVVWPLSSRLRIKGELEKAIGIDKATHRRLDLDPEPEEAPEEEPALEAEPKQEVPARS